MPDEPARGYGPRVRPDASPAQESDDPTACTRCGASADGLDPHAGPLCRDCGTATAVTDGGATEQVAEVDIYSLTGFQRDLLAVLVARTNAGAETPGQRIAESLETRGYEDVNHGRLYPNLDDLVEEGLVEKEAHAYDRRTNAYRPTDHGRSLIEQYARSLAVDVGLETGGSSDG